MPMRLEGHWPCGRGGGGGGGGGRRAAGMRLVAYRLGRGPAAGRAGGAAGGIAAGAAVALPAALRRPLTGRRRAWYKRMEQQFFNSANCRSRARRKIGRASCRERV